LLKKILLSLFLLYTIVGFFLIPYLLKPEIIKNANNYLNATLSVEKVSFNPFLLKLSLYNLKVQKEKDQLLSLKELRCDLEPHQLFTQTIYLKELLLLGLDLHILKDKKGRFNFETLLKPQPDTPKEEQTQQPLDLTKLPHIHLAKVGIDESNIVIDDHSKKTPFHFVLKDFRVLLQAFDTTKLTNSDANIHLFTNLEDGGLIDIKTALTKIAPNPADGIETQTKLKVEIKRLYNEWQYLRDALKLEVADGALQLYSSIKLNTDDINATEISNTSLALQRVRIKPKTQNKDILTLKSVQLLAPHMQPLQNNINIASITVDNLFVKASRLKDGNIDWQNFLASTTPKEQHKQKLKTQPIKSKPLHFLLDNFVLKNSRIIFKDKKVSPNVDIALDNIKLDAQHITLTPHEQLHYKLAMKINKTANFKADGALSITPLTQKGTLKLQHLALRFLNPYIAQSSYLKLQDGYLNFSTKEEFSQNKTTLYKANGSVSLDELFVNDTRDNKSLLSLSHFKLKDFTLDSTTNALTINNAVLDSFYVDALVTKNKEFNLAQLTKPTQSTKEKQQTQTKTKQAQKPFAFLLKKLTIKDGSAKFADLSLPIPFKTDIHDLNGALYTLTNKKGRKTAMKLNGEIDRYGSTKIDLKTDASNPKKYTKVSMNFSNLAMNSLSGYSATFAGHKIDDGKLYLNLNYNLHNSKIKGDNSIIIKKIKIGEELKDENTTSLPLGFIVALLEDKDGIIDIDMPVEGDVDAPDFKYGSFVFKTFFNLLLKAVVSPFSFLGSVMGIDADELKNVTFEAGSSVILPPQKEKLDQLTKMLIKRPKIALSVTAGYNTQLDKVALQKQKLLKEAAPFTKEKKPLENENELTNTMLEKIYLKYAKKAQLKQLKKSTKKENYQEKLLNATTQLLPVTHKELLSLSTKRSQAIFEYLSKKGITKQRVKLLTPKESDQEESKVPTTLELVVP